MVAQPDEHDAVTPHFMSNTSQVRCQEGDGSVTNDEATLRSKLKLRYAVVLGFPLRGIAHALHTPVLGLGMAISKDLPVRGLVRVTDQVPDRYPDNDPFC